MSNLKNKEGKERKKREMRKGDLTCKYLPLENLE